MGKLSSEQLMAIVAERSNALMISATQEMHGLPLTDLNLVKRASLGKFIGYLQHQPPQLAEAYMWLSDANPVWSPFYAPPVDAVVPSVLSSLAPELHKMFMQIWTLDHHHERVRLALGDMIRRASTRCNTPNGLTYYNDLKKLLDYFTPPDNMVEAQTWLLANPATLIELERRLNN